MTQRHPRALMQDGGDAVGLGGKRWAFQGLGSWASPQSGDRWCGFQDQDVNGCPGKLLEGPWKAAARTSSQLWVEHSFLDETYRDMFTHLTKYKKNLCLLKDTV